MSLAFADPHSSRLRPSSLPQEAEVYGLPRWDRLLSDFCLAWPWEVQVGHPRGLEKQGWMVVLLSLPVRPSLTSCNPKPKVTAPSTVASLPNSPSGFRSLFTLLGLGYHFLTVTNTPLFRFQSPVSTLVGSPFSKLPPRT